MSKLIIDVFHSFIKRDPVYNFLIVTFLGGLLSNLVAIWISQKYEVYWGLVLFVFALLFLIVIVTVYRLYERRKTMRKSLKCLSYRKQM
jgi:predicted membrane channel-forming protein YqfA (hemolysin III family)